MRKYLIVAAAAGGLLLLGGAPAYADENPVPAGPLGGILDPAGSVLDPANGVRLDNPLGEAPLVKVKPGSNTPALPALPTSAARPAGAVAPAENGLPAARTGLGGAKPAKPALPAADVVDGTLPTDDFSVANMQVKELLGGLMPDGSSPWAAAPGTTAAASAQESGLLDNGVPLLGGLGGLLPEPARTLPADDPDTSGMPAGGTDVDPPSTTPAPDADDPAASDPATSDPATSDPAAQPDPSGPGDDDKRLHEEPIDNEAGGRAFSNGRPVAGPDPDYK